MEFLHAVHNDLHAGKPSKWSRPECRPASKTRTSQWQQKLTRGHSFGRTPLFRGDGHTRRPSSFQLCCDRGCFALAARMALSIIARAPGAKQAKSISRSTWSTSTINHGNQEKNGEKCTPNNSSVYRSLGYLSTVPVLLPAAVPCSCM